MSNSLRDTVKDEIEKHLKSAFEDSYTQHNWASSITDTVFRVLNIPREDQDKPYQENNPLFLPDEDIRFDFLDMSKYSEIIPESFARQGIEMIDDLHTSHENDWHIAIDLEGETISIFDSSAKFLVCKPF